MTKETSLTAEERAFLAVVAKHPNTSLYGVYDRLGWSLQKANRVLSTLLAKGLIAVTKGMGRKGTPAQFLSLTPEGRDLCGLPDTPLTPTTNVNGSGAPMQPQSIPCAHHWTIEPANGPTSQGTCENCGQVGEFKNSIQDKSQGQPARRLPPLFDP